MNSLRLSILAIFSTLWLANAIDATAGPVAPTYTYYFTAGPDESTDYDGSSITIQDLNIIGWNLFGDPNGGLQSGTGDGSFVALNNVFSNDANTWTGSFTITSYGPTFPFGIDSFGGTLSYNGTQTDASGPTSGSLTSIFFGSGADPVGTWSTRSSSVPDSGTTLALLAIGCAALGLYHRRVRAS